MDGWLIAALFLPQVPINQTHVERVLDQPMQYGGNILHLHLFRLLVFTPVGGLLQETMVVTRNFLRFLTPGLSVTDRRGQKAWGGGTVTYQKNTSGGILSAAYSVFPQYHS